MNLFNHTKAANRTVQVAACIAVGMALAAPAYAAGSGMPWEGPLDQYSLPRLKVRSRALLR